MEENESLYIKIQPFVQKEAKDIADNVYTEKGTQFGVAKVPYHIHNGTDAPNVGFGTLHDRILPIHWTIPGTSAATATNYGVFWTAPFACTVIDMTEVHQTLGADAGAVTLQIEKLTDTTAPDSGIALLTTAFNLKAAVNTVQNGVIVKTVTSTVQDNTLAIGDRLCLKDSGVLTAVANVTIVVLLQF